jgi:hypothetical protein
MNKINRRDFLKISAIGLGAISLPGIRKVGKNQVDFPIEPKLGRVFALAEIKAKPDPESETLDVRYDDAIVIIKREVVGKPKSIYITNRLWYEIPEGYVYSLEVQPLSPEINKPLSEIPTYGSTPGFWAEVTLPYVDFILENPPARAPLINEMNHPRFYYSQVLWVDGIKTDDTGVVYYHAIERHGSRGDMFWVDARAFKPITPEDVSVISPGVPDKRIEIDVNHQTLSCFEGSKEILFTRVSTGAQYNNVGEKVTKWATPVGDYHAINRKYLSVHMEGGSAAAGYELFAVSWTSIFAVGGVAIHSTYWHNNYGEPMSHGCVNAKPEDAKFIFRWSQPDAPYDPGLIEIMGYAGTKVRVFEY